VSSEPSSAVPLAKANEPYAYFTVVGELDPLEITEQMGLQPTRSWRKGEICLPNRMERKFSRWSLASRLRREEPLEAHVDDVIAQLKSQPESALLVSRRYEGTMQLVGYFYAFYPGLSLAKNTVQELASLELTLDCDFYYLYSDSREDTDE
jgi:hypothetical protein